MKFENEGAQRYFDQIPDEWDALYSHENWLMYRINRLLRPGIYERYAFTFERCQPIEGATVLDIGCGTGRFAIEFAKRGARHVVGIDFAPAMIDFSRMVAQRMGVADRCEFICNDVVSYPFETEFDIVVALGFFDYVPHAEPVFRKVAALRPQHFVASFPVHTFLWGIQRHIRYRWIRRVPIFYYTRGQLEGFLQSAGFLRYDIVARPHALLLHASCRER
ncbi:MAG: class I SAM-dependent methyltransferase [bacterium]|nr:class I SAM-dependent methyltransferase [bacterium]